MIITFKTPDYQHITINFTNKHEFSSVIAARGVESTGPRGNIRGAPSARGSDDAHSPKCARQATDHTLPEVNGRAHDAGRQLAFSTCVRPP